MDRTLPSSRRGRTEHRPDVERLEARQLLSVASSPTAANAVVRADGTVNFDEVIQASAARATYGVDGSGENVAVIDTGVDYKNPAFGSGVVGSSTNKVVAGVDFTGSPNGILPTWQHGTGVAGLIAASDPTDPGVAPGAGIVALRVFGDDNTGSFATIARALAWVVQNHAQDHITAVNLSVSDGGNYQTNLFAADGASGQAITASVAALDALNIPVVVAAGNAFDGKTQGEGFPAVDPETISVAATDETKMTTKGGDPLAATSQRLGAAQGRASATDIAAPGVNLLGPAGDKGTAIEDGTSFATPQVAGTVLLLQQMYQKAYGTLPTVAQLDDWLQAGADPIVDAATGITIGRLNVAGALKQLAAQIQATAAARVTSSTTAPASPTTTVPAMTEVFVNGASLGSVPTAQLATTYARLFAMTGGAATNLRAWTAAAATVDLGTSKPSGVATHPHRAATNTPPRTHGVAIRPLFLST